MSDLHTIYSFEEEKAVIFLRLFYEPITKPLQNFYKMSTNAMALPMHLNLDFDQKFAKSSLCIKEKLPNLLGSLVGVKGFEPMTSTLSR